MDKFENRRQRLLQLLESPRFHGRGAKAEIARLAGIDLSYLSRML